MKTAAVIFLAAVAAVTGKVTAKPGFAKGVVDGGERNLQEFDFALYFESKSLPYLKHGQGTLRQAVAAKIFHGVWDSADLWRSAAEQARDLATSASEAKSAYSLPGTLKFEYDPNQQNRWGELSEFEKCAEKTPEQLLEWMQQFNRAYQEVTGDLPMLEIDPLWWVSCVGNSNTTAFDRNPLVLISKASSNEKSRAFEPFGSWKTWTFRVLEATWSNKLGTEAQFNGDLRRLKEFAASPAPVNEDFYTGEVINGPPEGYYSPNWKRTNPREASRYADFGIYEVSRGTDGYWSNLKFLDEAENLHFIHGVAHKAELATGPQTQARYFLRLIGNRKSATTLPGILRLTEKGQCSGLTPKRIVGWIQEFSTVYRTATGVPLILYTNNDWWTACTGNSNAIRGNDLFLAGSDFKPFGPWKTWKFRQTGQYGAFGNLIQFNGDLQQLKDVTIGSRLAAAV